ncbi:MAG TPA: response regulator [Thermodesulfobacteriota bacterium]|nr:response regulator [Thermodesulfobacteriota bacterium]
MNILIVHDSKSSILLIKTFIMSELSDALVSESTDVESGEQLLKNSKFDVIICGKQVIENGSAGFISKVKSMNRNCPIILVTSDSSNEKLNDIKASGINYVLSTPFNSVQLRSIILEACDLRTRRAHQRINIPGTKVIAHLDHDDLDGEVINISESGILCDFIGKKINSELINSTHVSVVFPPIFNNASIKNLSCKLLRLNVMAWDDDLFPECLPNHVRVVWQVVNMSFENKKILTDILSIAENNLSKLH